MTNFMYSLGTIQVSGVCTNCRRVFGKDVDSVCSTTTYPVASCTSLASGSLIVRVLRGFCIAFDILMNALSLYHRISGTRVKEYANRKQDRCFGRHSYRADVFTASWARASFERSLDDVRWIGLPQEMAQDARMLVR